MLSIQYILSLFKETKALQIVYFFMATSVLQVIDLFTTIFLANLFGEYLILAVLCLFSLVGLFFAVARIKKLTELINKDCTDGNFPESRFYELTGMFLASLLVFLPGFISSLLGLIIMLMPLSKNIGSYLSKKTSTDWHTVYEYMKI